MIYEYAVEPALVVDWAINGKGRYVCQFGLDHRRLVSDFPIDWRAHVVGEFYKHFDYDDSSLEFQNAQPEMDAFLQILSETTVPRGGTLDEDVDWIDGALVEHQRIPFQGVLVLNKPSESPEGVLDEKDLDSIRNRYWNLPSIKPTSKSATAIADTLTPMLKLATRVLVVDPNFDADKPRYRESLKKLVEKIIKEPRATHAKPRISLVTGIESAFKKPGESRDEQAEKKVAKNIVGTCSKNLPKLIPNGCQIELVVLKNRLGGERLHNRYVLTDVGGVILPFGLDEDSKADSYNTTDDLALLPKDSYLNRWRLYADGKGFDLVCPPVQIDGTMVRK